MTNLNDKMNGRVPFLIATGLLFVIMVVLVRAILSSTGGVFMYALDDPFIHMQLAKNLAISNTWGINPNEFGSASSSLLYTLLLAVCFKLFSVNVLIPFIINCIAALVLLEVVNKWLYRQGVNSKFRTVILILVIILTPLPVLIIAGMEHVLQCLFFFLFLQSFSSWISIIQKNITPPKYVPATVLIYAFLNVSIRYEGLFVVAIAGLLLLYYKRVSLAVQLVFSSVLAVLVFGIFSVSKGSYFLPNSVLVKSEQVHFSVRGILSFLQNVLVQKLTLVNRPMVQVPGTPPPGISLLTTQRLLAILPLVYLLFAKQLRKERSYLYCIIILLLCTLLHLSLAATGWFYRYEAYLIMSAVVLLSLIFYKYGRVIFLEEKKYTSVLAGILIFFLFFPALLRTAAAFSNAKQACVNIYEQQYQVARFINQQYDNDTIAANDIGAISFYSHARTVDLWGLGNIEVARSKKGNYWTPSFLDGFVRKNQVKLIVVYDEWFDKKLLEQWTKVGEWTISNNVITGGNTVSFYSVDRLNVNSLGEKLHLFEKDLPNGVAVHYSENDSR